MDIREVYSAYASIYESKVEEENIHEEFLDEDLDFIDNLSDEELDTIVQEMVEDYYEEGCNLDELELVFTEYLEEAKVTYGHDSDSGDGDLVSQVKKKKAEKEAKAKVSRDERVAKVERVKSSIKNAVKGIRDSARAKAKSIKDKASEKANNVKARAHEPIAQYLAKPTKDQEADRKEAGRGVFLGGRKDGKKGHGTKPLNYDNLKSKTRTSDGRKELRSVLKFDLKQRYRAAKFDSAKKQVKAYQKVSGKVRDLKDKGRAKVQGIKNAAARATRKATEAPRKAVKAVRNKTASALSSLADKIKTEGIELDAFDTVVAYLIDEGFATDFDHAQKIMTTLDSQLIEEVHQQQLEFVEAYLVTNADKKGNTPAWQGYKKGKKNVKTGEPLYKAADHLKGDKK